MRRWLLAIGIFMLLGESIGQRGPIFPQIELPHDYYYREMYLPQLTSGPSSVCWSPDGTSLIYSMAGSLWRQQLGDSISHQLTSGPGYDYQPDWSADGQSVIFTKYNRQALELHLLHLASGNVTPLTTERHVNVDPRISPDGKQVAFVSTRETGHFRIWIADLVDGQLKEMRPLSPERVTEASRYYYSQYDHQLSPSWSPDGKWLMMISNPEVIHGTGNIYKTRVDRYDPVLLQQEETTWKTKPDWAPDGRRIAYSSYIGRQWHQLWLSTSAEHGSPYPLTYGNFDITSARWSPDGNKIAYISNEEGNTSLWIFDLQTSTNRPVRSLSRKYLSPVTTLSIRTTVDGKRSRSRLSVTDDRGRSYFGDGAWVHADDGYDSALQPFENHYFHGSGVEEVTVPSGHIRIKAFHGLEYHIIDTTIWAGASNTEIALAFKRLSLPDKWSLQWVSGDVHVHMNYGGHYRNVPFRLVQQAAAEDLDIVFNTIVNKEQRIIDYNYFIPYPDPASNASVLLSHGQEYHTSLWGHLGLLGLNDHFLLPGYASYPNTAMASPFPSNSAIADLAHKQNALVGYVHPFYDPPNPSGEGISHQLPVDVALGKVDYYEVVGFSWHKESASVWYRLLNCGFKISAAGGTDAMANYASLRGPVGMNRTYVHIGDQTLSDPAQLQDRWLAGLKAGRTIATNGPILGLQINDQLPGSEINLTGKTKKVSYSGFLRSIVPIDHLEIVQNGKVVKTIQLNGDKKSADIGGELVVSQSSWILLRAWNNNATPDVYDIYPYGTTNPIFINLNEQPIRSAMDANYFIQWIERVDEAASIHPGYLNDAEKEEVRQTIRKAKLVFESRR